MKLHAVMGAPLTGGMWWVVRGAGLSFFLYRLYVPCKCNQGSYPNRGRPLVLENSGSLVGILQLHGKNCSLGKGEKVVRLEENSGAI